MEEKIQNCLNEIAEEHNIEILMAVEAGSRIWGFPSTDSDYDIRFIYRCPVEDYLVLGKNRRDVIERVEDQIDIVGWDVRKALSLSTKGNASTYEWVSSPIQYSWSLWAYELREFILENRSLVAYLMHNSSFCVGQYERYINNKEEVRYKRYMYAIRPALNVRYIGQYQDLPPVDVLQTLSAVEDSLDPGVTGQIDKWMFNKKTGMDLGYGPRDPILDDFIEESIKLAKLIKEEILSKRASKTIKHELATQLFRNIVME